MSRSSQRTPRRLVGAVTIAFVLLIAVGLIASSKLPTKSGMPRVEFDVTEWGLGTGQYWQFTNAPPIFEGVHRSVVSATGIVYKLGPLSFYGRPSGVSANAQNAAGETNHETQEILESVRDHLEQFNKGVGPSPLENEGEKRPPIQNAAGK